MQKLGWSMSEFLSKSLARRTRRRSADGKGLLVTGAAVAQPVSEKCKNKYFSQGSRNKVCRYSHFARVKQSARFHVHSSTNFTTSLVWYLYFVDQKLVMTYDVLRDGNYSTPSWGKLEGREEGRKEEEKEAWFLGLFPFWKAPSSTLGKTGKDPAPEFWPKVTKWRNCYIRRCYGPSLSDAEKNEWRDARHPTGGIRCTHIIGSSFSQQISSY